VKIVVLGCGNIGSVVARDLAENLPSAQIVLADVNKSRVEEAVSTIGRGNVSWVQVDASNHRELVNTLKKFDLTVGTLPGSMGFPACKAAIAAKVNMIDVSYMPEDVMALYEAAVKAKVCVVPDCGMSPGLGNILVGHALSRLENVASIYLLNGGLPEKPVPPMGYVITWSVKDLIEMYTRKVTIVSGGKVTKVPALSGLEEITFPRVGKLEAFYTDGLRTLLHTVKGAEDMWEKTLRYTGHVQKIKLLKALGFFDEKALKIGDTSVSPRELTAKLFEEKLRMPNVPDIVAMLVKVSGERKGRKVTYTYHLLDRYDKKHGVTAMARTTGYTASVVAKLVAKKAVEEKGVVPPEKLGMDRRFYAKFMSEMEKRELRVKESEKLNS